MELTFGFDIVIFEIKLSPQMTFKQVFDSVAKVMGHKPVARGIPFLLPTANASFFATLLKIAGIGILAVSLVDLVYVKTHSNNNTAITEAAAQCKGYVDLQKAGNARLIPLRRA